MANNEKGKEQKKQNKTPKKVVIRIVKKRKGIPSIAAIIIGSLILTVAINFFVNLFSYSGQEVGLSQIVSDISEEQYDNVVIKDDIVTLEYTPEDSNELVKKYALISENTDFYSVATDAGIDIKTLDNVYYEPKLAITFGDILTLIMIIGAFVLAYFFISLFNTLYLLSFFFILLLLLWSPSGLCKSLQVPVILMNHTRILHYRSH